MFDQNFEKLTMGEQEQFKRLVNWLLSHTFLLQGTYDFDDNMRRVSSDYIFVESNFQMFSEYFDYAGFRLQRDSNYGIISLSSEYDFNRQKFDKLTTLMIYVLRVIYEERREELSLSREIFISTGELIQKMITLGVVRKKPPNHAIRDSLRLLARFQIVEKTDGIWEVADTKLLILPTILFIVSNEKISNMYKLVEETEDEEAEENAFDTLA